MFHIARVELREQLVGDNSSSPPWGSLGLNLGCQSWPPPAAILRPRGHSLNPGSVVEEKDNSGLGAQDHSGVEHFSPASHIPLCFGPKGQ